MFMCGCTWQQPDALMVPQTALGSSQLGKYLYVADNGKAQQRMVSIGATYGDRIVDTKASQRVMR